MKSVCLKCARHQQLKGYRVCRDCYSMLWSLMLNNLSADLELTEDQTKALAQISEEMNRIILGAEETGLDIGDYAEYLVAKATECTDRVKAMLAGEEVTADAG